MTKQISNQNWLTNQLAYPQIYSFMIEKYINKLRKKAIYELGDDLGGVDINWLLSKKDQVAKIMASLFKTKELNFATLTHKIVQVKHKQRSVYIGKILENIVDSAILNVLLPKLKEYGMPGVTSYLPGCSTLKTVQTVSNFLKTTDSEIFLLKTDIVSYFDTIPTDPKSRLWKELDDFIIWLDPINQIEEYTYSLIKSRIMASYVGLDGAIRQRDIGILTGRPISSLVAILYLRELDITMSKLTGLYIRYSDDILWMTTSISDFEQGNTIISNKVSQLKLSRNPTKDLYATLTYSGNNYTGINKFKGIHRLEYLGLAISRKGSIALPLKHTKNLKKEIDDRIKNINKTLLDTKDEKQKIQIVVLAINQFLKSTGVLKRNLFTKHIINDRSFLKDLDFFIATRIIMISTNTYKLHMFKKYNYKWLRRECKLISLCNVANNLR